MLFRSQQTGNNSAPRYGDRIQPGARAPGPNFQRTQSTSDMVTYVPTRIQLTIGAVPIVSRNDISRRFSLYDYGSGELLRGSQNGGAGIW